MRYGRKRVHGRFASPDEECLCQTNHIQWHIASDSPLQPIKKVRKVDFERICSVSNKLMTFKDMQAQNKKICSGCLNYCLNADPIPLPGLPPMENNNIAPAPNAIVNEHLLSNATQTNHDILVLDLTNEDDICNLNMDKKIRLAHLLGSFKLVSNVGNVHFSGVCLPFFMHEMSIETN